jgi:hypothetical protein
MTDDPRRPPAPTPERTGVEGGDRDVSTDQQPPASGVPAESTSEGGMRGEERREADREGGMAGEGF